MKKCYAQAEGSVSIRKFGKLEKQEIGIKIEKREYL